MAIPLHATARIAFPYASDRNVLKQRGRIARTRDRRYNSLRGHTAAADIDFAISLGLLQHHNVSC